MAFIFLQKRYQFVKGNEVASSYQWTEWTVNGGNESYLVFYVFLWMWCLFLIAKIVDANDTALLPHIGQCQFCHLDSSIRCRFQCINIDIFWLRFFICKTRNHLMRKICSALTSVFNRKLECLWRNYCYSKLNRTFYAVQKNKIISTCNKNSSKLSIFFSHIKWICFNRWYNLSQLLQLNRTLAN